MRTLTVFYYTFKTIFCGIFGFSNHSQKKTTSMKSFAQLRVKAAFVNTLVPAPTCDLGKAGDIFPHKDVAQGESL